jgi:hypothetical protein
MKGFRVPLAAFMASIPYFGFAFAALRRPTPAWSGAWFTATLGVLAVAILGAVYSRRRGSRAFCGGFAIVGGGFVALNLIPGVAPHLVNQALAARHYRTMSYAPEATDAPVWVQHGARFLEGHMESRLAGGSYRVVYAGLHWDSELIEEHTGAFPPTSLRPLSPDGYQQLCHSILALPLALVGGLVARGFAGQRQERDGR